VEFILTS